MYEIEKPVNASDFLQDSEGDWWRHITDSRGNFRSRAVIRLCKNCKKEFLIEKCRLKENRGIFCSNKCRATGRHNANWKGGKRLSGTGYVEILMPEHPYSYVGGYVKERRIVMENMIGRYLEPYENVHHKNGIRTDNRPENLELWVKSQPSGARFAEAVKHCPTCTCCGGKE